MDGTRILVDCGLFQGRREEARRKNQDFPIDAPGLHNAILTHAHIDHSGALPLLVKRGFRGEIFCAGATADLTTILLRDSGMIHEKDAEYLGTVRTVFVVHGEPKQSRGLSSALLADGHEDVRVPELGSTVELG